MSLYGDLKNEAWFQDLRRYAVVVDLEARGKGGNLYYNDEFLGMISNGNFRGVCLNDVKFSDKLLEPQFFDFLGRLKWKNRFNAAYKAIGALLWLALAGGTGYALWSTSLAEKLPWLKGLSDKMTFAFDKGDLKNPIVLSVVLFLTSVLVGWIVYEIWTYFILTRYGFCKKCGNFVFGKHVFNVKCRCAGWIKFLS